VYNVVKWCVGISELTYFDELLLKGGAFSQSGLAETALVGGQPDITYFIVNSPNFGTNCTGFQNLT
jgi:hypothetical protein